ncbi:hypothetical protein PHYPSEUDO_013298 [Phytophthora pseudosyringae]|uniref:RxLR effector protein n=1 Tax=Phytophthora pseudosyringae TaxID=221518 RepID=A0A8T1V879_9STRA|nr:hypothetical protein PHYPSEUDO_013298 [Phytophthora pseudosyringae]
MRPSYFLLALLLAFAACVSGLADNAQVGKVKTFADRTVINGGRNLKGSSTVTDATEEERGGLTKVSEMLKGAGASFANLFGKSTATEVQALQKNTKLVNSIKSDSRLNGLKAAVQKNPGALTEKKVGKIGEFVAKLKKIEFVGDVKGMRIAYGILFLGIIGILVSGAIITHNVQSSYIH